MNCWRNVADKFDTSPEDAEKIVKGIHLFFSQRSQRSYGNRLIFEIIGIARIAELIFQRFWRSQQLNGNRLAHQMLVVQLSGEKNPASSSISAVNLSVILKEIERTTLICDYF